MEIVSNTIEQSNAFAYVTGTPTSPMLCHLNKTFESYAEWFVSCLGDLSTREPTIYVSKSLKAFTKFFLRFTKFGQDLGGTWELLDFALQETCVHLEQGRMRRVQTGMQF